MSPPDGTIVMATRDRAAIVPGTLERLLALPEGWPVILVDDASTDGTADVVRDRFPEVQVIRLPESRGAGARNVGVATATTELVAFADDDSWFAPGSLATAAEHFAAHADLGLIAARCIVEPEGDIDPVSRAQEASPLPSAPPGPSVLGFLACTAVVRRRAFLDAGGFHPVIGFLGEEDVLAMDLRTNGWRLVHVPEVVVHHHPGQTTSGRSGRRALQLRNEALTRWLRRPLPVALAGTGRLAAAATRDADARTALAGVAARLPAALADRRRIPGAVESDLRTLEARP
ncbi:MAG: glycosyltransferase family 2 protein [Acidimicrobiia bacterium]